MFFGMPMLFGMVAVVRFVVVLGVMLFGMFGVFGVVCGVVFFMVLFFMVFLGEF